MRTFIFVVLLFIGITSFAQTRVYKGYINKYPISLTMYSYSDGVTNGMYVYNKYDTPIPIKGILKNNTLTLLEKDKKGKVIAALKFYNFNPKLNTLKGQWITQNKKKQLNITLTKLLEFDSYDNSEFESKEFLQSESTAKHYFKLLLSKTAGNSTEVVGVRVYQKKTDKLLQEIELNCQFLGVDNVSVGDFNFDGITDFSVFEASYTGPNTSNIYFLKEPNTTKYLKSSFSGTSLEFDAKEKLIYEHNQCCAGRNHTNATYKVVNNQMVLIKKECLTYDDEKEDYVKTKCE